MQLFFSFSFTFILPVLSTNVVLEELPRYRIVLFFFVFFFSQVSKSGTCRLFVKQGNKTS